MYFTCKISRRMLDSSFAQGVLEGLHTANLCRQHRVHHCFGSAAPLFASPVKQNYLSTEAFRLGWTEALCSVRLPFDSLVLLQRQHSPSSAIACRSTQFSPPAFQFEFIPSHRVQAFLVILQWIWYQWIYIPVHNWLPSFGYQNWS